MLSAAPSNSDLLDYIAALEGRLTVLERQVMELRVGSSACHAGVRGRKPRKDVRATVAAELAKDPTASASVLVARAGVRKQVGLRVVSELRQAESRFLSRRNRVSESPVDVEEPAA